MLILDLVVPGEKRERQVGYATSFDPLETGDQLFPKAGGGPVFDCERCAHRLVVVVAAIQPEELVAEMNRARDAVTTLAHIIEGETQRLTEPQHPLEVRGLKSEFPAVDRSFC